MRSHPLGKPYSVIRGWNPDHRGFHGWYINLELPWRRSVVGFDSRDLILDVLVESDLSGWTWKDQEQLEWAVEQQILTPGQGSWIRSAGEDAISDLANRTAVFTDTHWARWAPDPAWTAPAFPLDWAASPCAQEFPQQPARA